VVGHSMGGQLVRLYLSDVANNAAVAIHRELGSPSTMLQRNLGLRGESWHRQYLRPRNYWMGDIRRFVAFGSPFKGTPVAMTAAVLTSDQTLFHDAYIDGSAYDLRTLLMTDYSARTRRNLPEPGDMPALWNASTEDPNWQNFRPQYERLADTLRRRVTSSLEAVYDGSVIIGYTFNMKPRNAYEDLAITSTIQPGEVSMLQHLQSAAYPNVQSGPTQAFSIASFAGGVGFTSEYAVDIYGAVELGLQRGGLDLVSSVNGVQGIPARFESVIQSSTIEVTGLQGDGVVPAYSQLNAPRGFDRESPDITLANALMSDLRHSRYPAELPDPLGAAVLALIPGAGGDSNQLDDRLLVDQVHDVLDGMKRGYRVNLN
jgi:hypothetical protein